MTTSLLALLLTAGAKTEADQLFLEARELMGTRPQEACPKFARSYELDPALGTLLNLGICFELTARWASAWIRFNQSKDWAVRTHEADREKLAREHAQVVAPRVSWLALSCATPRVGLEVEVGDQKVHLDSPLSIPIDPGSHHVVATAPGFRPWTMTVEAPAPGETLRVLVPALEPMERPKFPSLTAEPRAGVNSAGTPRSPPAVIHAASPFRAPGAITLSTGAALLAASTVGLIYSLDVYFRAQGQRSESQIAGEGSVSRPAFEMARSLYPIALGGLGAGVVSSAIGIWLLARDRSSVSVAALPMSSGMVLSLVGSY